MEEDRERESQQLFFENTKKNIILVSYENCLGIKHIFHVFLVFENGK